MNLESTLSAAEDRSRGNMFMRANDFKMAIRSYSKSLLTESDHATTLCNRAMAFLKNGDYTNCIKDADKAIRLEPYYVKAYHRRGKAHLAKQNWR